MKRLVGGLILATAFGVQADPQLDSTTENCHFPKGPGNTDNEWKASCTIVLDEDADGGAKAGYGFLEVKGIPLVERVDQDCVSAECNTRPGSTIQVSTNSNAQCTLINNDDTEYQVDDWVIVFNSTCYGNPNFCDYTYRVYCGYDIQSVIDAYYIE